MNTECKPKQFEFHDPGPQEVLDRFAGGEISSEGGGLLLREVDAGEAFFLLTDREMLDQLETLLSEHRVRHFS